MTKTLDRVKAKRQYDKKGVLNRRFKRRFAYFAAVGKVGRAAARNSPKIKPKVIIKPNRTKNKSPSHIVIIITISHFCKSKYTVLQKQRGAVIAIIDYGPLWRTMERNNVSQYQLLQNGVDNRTLDSLKKNRNITMATLEKLCRIVGCTPNDVVMFK